jgi:hypothetical protein
VTPSAEPHKALHEYQPGFCLLPLRVLYEHFNSVVCGGVCWRFGVRLRGYSCLATPAQSDSLSANWNEFPTLKSIISHFPLFIISGIKLQPPTEFSPVRLFMIAD